MSITFRAVQEGDFSTIKEIYDWYILHSTATYHTDPIKIEELKEFIYVNHPRYKSYLIQDNSRTVGYCYLSYYKKRQAYDRTSEITLYLRHNCTGNGIGSTALTYLEDRAKESGIVNLLAIISGDNTGSIRLFQKCGYHKCAHFKNVGEKFNKILDVVAFQKEI